MRHVETGDAHKQFIGAAAWKYPSLNRMLCIKKILHTRGTKSTMKTYPLPIKLAPSKACPNNKKMLTISGGIF